MQPPDPDDHDDDAWIAALTTRSTSAAAHPPAYFLRAPAILKTTARLHSYTVGTGARLFRETVCPLVESAERSVVFVTCFWAPSPSLALLCASLRALSDKARARGDGRRIKVFIGFSSRSLWQKLAQTSSPEGRTYGPDECASLLGLPRATDLPGLEVRVKSVFALPFSVLHPKFVVVDGERAALPSCNVSWEEWFEGVAVVSGDVVAGLLRFWRAVWEPDAPDTEDALDPRRAKSLQEAADADAVSAVVLPSPHHRWHVPLPFFPSQPPATPLNDFLLARFASAQRTIFLQTPNVTAAPVTAALLAALRRGVDVRIVTSRRLMRAEQIVTAGTTTGCVVRALAKSHAALLRPLRARVGDEEEGGLPRMVVGRLRIEYFRAPPGSDEEAQGGEGGPVQTHVKVSAFDGRVVVLGSGNMDRASWYTSQELGLALRGEAVVARVLGVLDKGMAGRSEVFYDSADSDP
jgi:phosphatidylserine/phosphatidylglycerophosphate/cardiolipin synthase-like enzyme